MNKVVTKVEIGIYMPLSFNNTFYIDTDDRGMAIRHVLSKYSDDQLRYFNVLHAQLCEWPKDGNVEPIKGYRRMTLPGDPKLLPCPFCGGNATFEWIGGDGKNATGNWSVGCDERGGKLECYGYLSHTSFSRKVDAANAWNMRYSDWQPIETAPRNGDPILVCDNRILDGFHQVVFYEALPEKFNWCWQTSDGPTFHVDAFTHWKPLDHPKPKEEVNANKTME